jgi:hypothetical protein
LAIHSRPADTAGTVLPGHAFSSALTHCADGTLQVDVKSLSATEPEDPEHLRLPQCH